MTLRTELTERYGCVFPFVQAGLALVGATLALATAVGRAGGIGGLGIGPMPAPAVRDLIRAVRAATEAPFHVNFITFLAQRAQIEGVRRGARADRVVPLGAPATRAHRRPASGGLPGLGAGGERRGRPARRGRRGRPGRRPGQRGGRSQPRLAAGDRAGAADRGRGGAGAGAGGIADGRGVVAALALGAAGVWVGTRLVASTEAYAYQGYKQRLIEAAATETRLSSLFGPEMAQFNPMRVLANRVVRACEGREHQRPADTSAEPVIGTTALPGETLTLRRFSSFVPMPTTTGDLDEMALPAGQGVGPIRAIEPAETIVLSMMAEAEEIALRLGRPQLPPT